MKTRTTYGSSEMPREFVDSRRLLPEMSDFGVIAHSERGDIFNTEPSKTRQEFAEECDINTLMARYEAGGAITHVNKAQPIYMDVTSMPDLRQYLDIMREASTAFAALPAKARKEFDNDPQQFVDFAQDPKNLERMREWGLAPPAAVPDAPIRVEVIAPPVPLEPGPKT